MLQASKQLNIDLWDAWIEFDPLHPDHFGVLYISGEVETKKKVSTPLAVNKLSQQGMLNTLVLQITEADTEGGNYIKEVMYSEPLYNLNQYNAVVIYVQEEIVTVIKDIEILI
jgi:hypothetical protein